MTTETTTSTAIDEELKEMKIRYEESLVKEYDAFCIIMKTHISVLRIEDLFMSHLTFPDAINELREKLYEICLNSTYTKFNKNDFEYFHYSVRDEPEYAREYFFDDNFNDYLLNS